MEFYKLKQLVSSLTLGKNLPDAIYIHESAIGKIPLELSELVLTIADTFNIDTDDWNILKFSKREHKITFLSYPRFEEYAYPELHRSFTANIQRMTVRETNYSSSENPPILHRKETFVTSDYPLFDLFKAITSEGEKIGLYEKTRSIGFKKNWERLINNKGYFLDEAGRLHKKDELANTGPLTSSEIEIERHKTAIDRNKLSSPMQALARHGYFDGEHSLLDYGCGKGDDIRELEAHGLDVDGWDPAHHTKGKLKKHDIVNLGFVLNVIEDIQERKDTLKKAFSYAKQLLIASVMVAGESVIRQFTPYKDGVITSRNTFQRYYTQSEFKEYLEDTLSESAIAVGQGIFIIFKDKIEEQRFLFERQHLKRNWRQITQRAPSTHTKVVTKDLIEKHKEIFDDFWVTSLDLGRLPANSEFEFSDRIRSVAGSHKKAFDALIEFYGEDDFQKSQEIRKNDLLVYFALGQFAKRKPYSKMPDDLKRDIKVFFGSYQTSLQESLKLLFSVGQADIIEDKSVEAFNSFSIGELSEGHSWVIPKTLLPELPPELRVYVGCACQLYGDIDDMHLIKIHFTSGKVSLMRYDDFNKEIPLLMERVKIKLRQLDVDFFNYGGEYTPPPLNNKNSFT